VNRAQDLRLDVVCGHALLDLTHAVFQVLEREAVRKGLEHAFGGGRVGLELPQLRREGGLVERRRAMHRRPDERALLVERYLATGVDDAGAKLDGRDVPFADGAQAHDEAQSAFCNSLLMRRLNH
jgi:hypothetical protein